MAKRRVGYDKNIQKMKLKNWNTMFMLHTENSSLEDNKTHPAMYGPLL